MTSQFAWALILLTFTGIMVWFLTSQDKVKKKIGIGMLIAFGVMVVLPIAAGLLFLLTCFGIIGLGSMGH